MKEIIYVVIVGLMVWTMGAGMAARFLEVPTVHGGGCKDGYHCDRCAGTFTCFLWPLWAPFRLVWTIVRLVIVRPLTAVFRLSEGAL